MMPTVVVPWLRGDLVRAYHLDPKRWRNTRDVLDILDDLAWAELWVPGAERTAKAEGVLF